MIDKLQINGVLVRYDRVHIIKQIVFQAGDEIKSVFTILNDYKTGRIIKACDVLEHGNLSSWPFRHDEPFALVVELNKQVPVEKDIRNLSRATIFAVCCGSGNLVHNCS